jgi:deoxyribodipyrimidine photolyase
MTEAEQEAAACRIGTDYPVPIVDHAGARLRALDFFGSMDGTRARA